MKTQSGDIYAGKDGNVYKKTDTGWSKYSDGGWTPVNPQQNLKNSSQPVNSESQPSRAGTRSQQSAQSQGAVDRRFRSQSSTSNTFSSQGRGTDWGSTREQLDSDFSARSRGEGRTQDYGAWRDRFGSFGGERQGFDSFGSGRQGFGVGRGGRWRR